jgi:5-formyltetrahydrofolate cyclo-ligase
LEKQQLRKRMKDLRDSLHKPNAGENLKNHFLANIKLKKNAIIASYSAINSEIDTNALNLSIIELGYTLCLPVIEDEVLIFKQWNGKDALVNGKYGIKTPEPTSPSLKPDYIIIPLYAFDENGHRLGYGGGYYDRTLPLYDSIKIGVGYEEQKVENIPVDEFDVRMDLIITDSKFYG